MEPLSRYVLPVWRADREAMHQALGPPVRLGSSGLDGWPAERLTRYNYKELPPFRFVMPGQLPGWTGEEERR